MYASGDSNELVKHQPKATQGQAIIQEVGTLFQGNGIYTLLKERVAIVW